MPPTAEPHSTKDLVASMAERYSLSPDEFKRVIKATCGLQKATDEEFLAFLMIAHQYDLNPITKEIYAFVKSPERGGGIQTIVGVDGWFKIMNKNPAHNGIQFRDEIQGGQLVSITATIYRKDRTHPTEAIEYMHECRRNTDPWRQWPARMLRHKAAIQAIRIAYNLAGLMDPDEAERYMEMLDRQPPSAIEIEPDDLPGRTSGTASPASGAAAEPTDANPTTTHDGRRKRPVVTSPPHIDQPPANPPVDELISEEDSDALIRSGGMVGMGASKLKKFVQEKFGVNDLNELRKSQAEELKADLRKRTADK